MAKKLRITHDPDAGAAYVALREIADGEVARTVQLVPGVFGVNIDYDARGEVVGFEFLCADELELKVHPRDVSRRARAKPKGE